MRHAVRYIAGPPAALRGTRPSQASILVKRSASDAKVAPAPVVWTDCRTSVVLRGACGQDFLRVHSSNGGDDLSFFLRWRHSLVCGECRQRFSL